MSNEQFKTLIMVAAGFLAGNILIWGLYALYLIVTGRA